MKKRACLIIPYFGKKPQYFEMWSLSASKNKEYDFYILSDIEFGKVPDNVYIIKLKFSEIKEVIQKRFDFKIALENPYKLCDYKPAYGYLFPQLIKEYDFWGYCDMDMILGQLSHFLKEPVWEYDKIYKLGHLTLYRNNERINTLFMREIPGEITYREAFGTNYVCHFDESGIMSQHEKLGLTVYDNFDFWDVKYNYFPFKSYWEGKWTSHIFEWNKGSLLKYSVTEDMEMEIREICYVHMQKRKIEVCESSCTDGFMIIPNKIIPCQESYRNKECILELNKQKFYPITYFIRCKQIWTNMRNGAIKMRIKKKMKRFSGNVDRQKM